MTVEIESPELTKLLKHPSRRAVLKLAAVGAIALSILQPSDAWAQTPNETLIVAGPRTPESLDQEYPPTEAVHEMRRNVYERLLAYEMAEGDDGVLYEDFDTIGGSQGPEYYRGPCFPIAMDDCWFSRPQSADRTERLGPPPGHPARVRSFRRG